MFDVVIVGGGVSGINLLRNLNEKINSILITDKKLGKSNSLMAQGGIQVPDNNVVSKNLMVKDILNSGRGKSIKKLVENFVSEINYAYEDLISLGILFKKEKENYLKLLAGGCSEKRVLTTGDMLGVQIVKKLMSEVNKKKRNFLEFTEVIHIEKFNNNFKIIIKNLNTEETKEIESKIVVLCCGGTTYDYALKNSSKTTNIPNINHKIRLVCKKLGLKMTENIYQYQPFGLIYPKLRNRCLPEKISNFNIEIVNKFGEKVCSTKEDRLDIVNKINNCFKDNKQIITEDGENCVELKFNKKLLDNFETHFPKFFKDFGNKVPEKIYITPILHYELSGIKTDENQSTSLKNIFCCGEMSYGIHGDNRLMGLGIIEGLVSSKTCADYINYINPK